MEQRSFLSSRKHHGQMSESFLTASLLSLSGGLQDAYTYLARGEVFANAQTGNIVLMSVRLFEGAWAQAMRYLVPLTAFFLGVLAAELLHLRYKKMERFHWRQLVLLGEIVLLAAVGFFPQSWNLLAKSVVSFACAMQVQAFRKVDGYAFASTMCIGNLRSGTESLCAWWSCGAPQARKKAGRYFGVIALFGIGAGLGGALLPHLGLGTIWISCALLTAAFVVMFVREEQ